VRGLDYYCRTVYEIKHSGLGARDTICGGGRYDGLVELLGGPSSPCVGFGIGAEATLIAMQDELGDPEDVTPRPDVYAVCFEKAARGLAFELVMECRRAGLSAEMDYQGRSAKAQMRSANKLDAKVCFLLGSNELEGATVAVKDMAESRQWDVPRTEAAAAARDVVKGKATEVK
jgi:histidyl-tRNA synthetase